MDQAVTQLLSWGSIYLAVAVVIITFFVRRIVETAVPSAKKAKDENEDGLTYATTFSKWWNKVFLYLVPVLVGAGLGAADIVPGLDGMVASLGGRLMSGSIIGWMSSFIYKVLRMALKKRTGIDLQPADE